MCGIVGIVNLRPQDRVSPKIIKKMTDAIAHRGPDGEGLWISPNERVGLGHRRLSIIDLTEAGKQPMATPDGKIQVTFNGEIYNYPELKKDLEKKGYQFKSKTDTEILLYLYREIGFDMVYALDGDFSFAIWDEEKQKLLLARDRAGVKPLYYSIIDNKLIFASEIKAILQHPIVQPNIDEESLYHYLSFLVVPPPKTLIQDIQKLPAAGWMTIDLSKPSAQIKQNKYWLPLRREETIKHLKISEYDEKMEDLIKKSVKKRLMSDVPVGTLFSGGVDSTLNTCLFGELITPKKVRTYNVGLGNVRNYDDESSFAKRIAKKLETEHFETSVSDLQLLEKATELAYFQDEPISDPVCIPLYFITKYAKETGTTVLHAGEGADEIFCGYDSYRRFLRHEEQLWRPLSKMPRMFSSALSGLMKYSQNPRTKKIRDVLYRRGKNQELFMGAAIAYYEQEKQNVLTRGFKSKIGSIDSFDIIAPYYEELNQLQPDSTFLEKMTYLELQLRLPELLLMRVDKMSMANSVEVRVPFLDRDLVDFALAVPQNYKLRDGVSKEPVKRFASKYVGRDSIYRPKKGFGVPINEWFQGRLGVRLLELVDADDWAKQVFNFNYLQKQLERSSMTVNQAFQLWVIYNFMVWKSQFK